MADTLYFAEKWEAGNNMDVKLRNKCSIHLKIFLYFRLVI